MDKWTWHLVDISHPYSKDTSKITQWNGHLNTWLKKNSGQNTLSALWINIRDSKSIKHSCSRQGNMPFGITECGNSEGVVGSGLERPDLCMCDPDNLTTSSHSSSFFPLTPYLGDLTSCILGWQLDNRVWMTPTYCLNDTWFQLLVWQITDHKQIE